MVWGGGGAAFLQKWGASFSRDPPPPPRVVVGHQWVLCFVRFEECQPLGLELWGCCLCLCLLCCDPCQLTMKVTCRCGMVVSDHDNAMREHA